MINIRSSGYPEKVARNPKDIHRSVDDIDDLSDYFCWKEDRTVSKNLTLQYDKIVYFLEPTDYTKKLYKKRVTVYDYPDGRLDIRHEGKSLRYGTFDKVRQVEQANVVSNKRLGAVLQHIKDEQEKNPMERSKKAPRRTGQGKRK